MLVSGTTTGKIYFAQHRMPGARGPKRVNMGAVTGFKSVEEARSAAAEAIRMIRDGRDPLRERRQAALQQLTLAEALDHYTDTIKDLGAKTIKMYRNHVNRHRCRLAGQATEGHHVHVMVAERHSRIGASTWPRPTAWSEPSAPSTTSRLPATRRCRPIQRCWESASYTISSPGPTSCTPNTCPASCVVRALPNPVARDYLLAVLLTGMEARR